VNVFIIQAFIFLLKASTGGGELEGACTPKGYRRVVQAHQHTQPEVYKAYYRERKHGAKWVDGEQPCRITIAVGKSSKTKSISGEGEEDRQPEVGFPTIPRRDARSFPFTAACT
jgi:hypothetical protein